MKINVRSVRGSRRSKVLTSIEAKNVDEALLRDDEIREQLFSQMGKRSHFIPDLTLEYEEADKTMGEDFFDTL